MHGSKQIIKMLAEMIECSHKIKEEMKATQSEIKKNIEGTNSEGKENKIQINKRMLDRTRRKGNPSALLVGMQTGEATVENSMEFPQKTKDGTAL